MLTPYFNERLPDFENWVGYLMHAPVSIGKVSITWEIYEPILTFDDVKILNPKTHKPNFQINRAKINISLLKSLLTWKPCVESIKVSGVHLTVHQGLGGKWSIEGLSVLQVTDNLSGGSVQATDVLVWVFTVPHLLIEDVNVLFQPDKGDALSFTLYNLVLNNSSRSHALVGRAVLNQEIPTKLKIALDWTGDFNDIPKITAHAYVYIQGVNLTQWLGQKVWRNLQIKQGLGSVKIWVDWDKADWKEVQSTMQFYDLEVYSLLTKKTQNIPRFNGHVGWRKEENDKQIIAGDQIFLDLPEHLWPVTSFAVTYSAINDGIIKPDTVKIGYFDLGDIKNIATLTGLVPDKIQKQLTLLEPKGEISNLKFINHVAPPPIPPFKREINTKYYLNAVFSGLSFNSWDKYPGVKNISGNLNWNGEQGVVNIKSNQSEISLNQLFAKDLQFEKLNASLKIQHDANNQWMFNLKDFSVLNNDMKAQAEIKLDVPVSESPIVNLDISFDFFDMAHFRNYLPIKVLDPDLATWLQNAFKSGQLEKGEIIINGRVADFPFDNNNGKFIFSGNVKNMDFNYAPGWPLINKLNGKLVFSGRVMTIDLSSGEMLNVPLTDVHAVIPYIGDEQPQILTVQSEIQVDLASLLHFIHESPLEKNIGSALGNMSLNGDSHLKLNLTIPLRKPETAKVQGDLSFSDAVLGMRDIKLSLEKLQGNLSFTENDINAKDLKGTLLGEDAVLNITTQHPANAPSFVQASLLSQIDVAALQKIFKISLAPTVEGKAAFSVGLHLYSTDLPSKVSEVTVHSDLKGLSLHLPDIYGKKPDEVRDLQVNVMLKKQMARVKVDYANQLAAALDFDRSDGAMKFFSGEVSLGGEANWQTQPGLLLSGDFKRLDWDTLRQNSFSSSTSNFDTSYFRGIKLNVDKFKIYGQELNDAHIELSKDNRAWLVKVISKEIVGQLNVSGGDALSSIQGRFDRFHLSPMVDNNKSALDPKSIPRLSIVANDVRYDGKSFGNLSLRIEPGNNLLTIRELQITSPLVSLRAEGEWQVFKKNNSTHLHGSINTSRLSDLLSSWGYDSSDFVVNKGDIDFNLTWPNTPYQPTVVGLSGNVSISLGKGRVNVGESNNAKMDIGRLLNLFSLSSIPRRLTGDFSDVTEKGYSFDEIKGDFNLKNGQAFTTNAYSEGAIARVDISGRIGLATKDFDLAVGVVPHVTSTLSTVVALSAWNPIVSVPTWVVGQLVGKAVSKATFYRYTVTGPWNNPSWRQANH